MWGVGFFLVFFSGVGRGREGLGGRGDGEGLCRRRGGVWICLVWFEYNLPDVCLKQSVDLVKGKCGREFLGRGGLGMERGDGRGKRKDQMEMKWN